MRARGLHQAAQPRPSFTGSALMGAPGVLLVAALVVGGLIFPQETSVASAAVTVGRAEITQVGVLTPLDSGGSSTSFGVTLPPGAKCPGDTAHDGYHVFSYLVPQGVVPTEVRFKGIIPGKYFGYIAQGEYYYGAADTAPYTGQVVDIPPFFVFSRLTPHDLFTAGATRASWDGGIACVNVLGGVTNYWNTKFVFTASTSDPGGFTWAVVNRGSDPPAPGVGFPTWLALVVAGAALLAAGVVFGIGRRVATREPKEVGQP